MKRLFVAALLLAGLSAPCLADRPVLLITPGGVYQSEVVNGIPGPWIAQEIDVIVQGFGGGTDTPVPVPPVVTPNDPQVASIAAISKTGLKDKAEATAVAAIISSMSKMGLTGANFTQALVMAAPIADTSLKAEGRITKWVKDATAVSNDPVKLKAGVQLAWDVSAASLDTIHSAATATTGAAISEEALNFAQIIQIITMILELLKNIGIIPAA